MAEQQTTEANEIRIAGPVGEMGYFFIHDLENRVWCELRQCFIGFGLGFRTTKFREAFIEARKASAYMKTEQAVQA